MPSYRPCCSRPQKLVKAIVSICVVPRSDVPLLAPLPYPLFLGGGGGALPATELEGAEHKTPSSSYWALGPATAVVSFYPPPLAAGEPGQLLGWAVPHRGPVSSVRHRFSPSSPPGGFRVLPFHPSLFLGTWLQLARIQSQQLVHMDTRHQHIFFCQSIIDSSNNAFLF